MRDGRGSNTRQLDNLLAREELEEKWVQDSKGVRTNRALYQLSYRPADGDYWPKSEFHTHATHNC